MSDGLTSVVLPVHDQAGHIRTVVTEYASALERSGMAWEIVLVPNACRDGSDEICQGLVDRHDRIRSVALELGGWGRAVHRGLREARGDLLCYTNSARTTPEDLMLLLLYARTFPGIVVKANRKIREHWTRRIGSLLYNIECRTLFDLSSWDINGTPKVFPRAFGDLLTLTRDDDMIDAEFCWRCRRAGHPMIEVPIFSSRRHGGKSTTSLRSAVRMYVGAYRMRRAVAA
ncbi:MAG TPA: glycosyltransferase [Candidatus Binatia bacterium]|nr:glycosyltransferase [Candidatus Binatia bacterium]